MTKKKQQTENNPVREWMAVQNIDLICHELQTPRKFTEKYIQDQDGLNSSIEAMQQDELLQLDSIIEHEMKRLAHGWQD